VTDPLLEIERVSLRLGQQHILEELSLSLFRGEFVTILGPSGAGKSTLFRLLTGALRPDSGAIRVQGEELQPNDRSFALMPQRDALMPWRRVIDNVILGLEVQGLSRRAARARVQPLFPVVSPTGVLLFSYRNVCPRRFSFSHMNVLKKVGTTGRGWGHR
jgi:ABC-type nitrate/sulfonate/bicarbonate transport system ATPase subunit